MKILITGTAGFIGYHVAKRLLEMGYEVVGLDNINDYYDVNLKYARLAQLGIEKEEIVNNYYVASKTYPKHQFIKLDLIDTQNINGLFAEQKFDAVCHLAAQAGVRYSIENPRVYIDSNIVGFLNILEGCRNFGVKSLYFASSSSVYGLNKSQPFKTSEHTDHPVSLYAATKKSNEMMAHSYAHLYGIEMIGLRFFTVYGPWGRPDMAPMLFADAIFNNRAINVFNQGNMSRDFTYIDDIVEGIIKVIDTSGEVKESIFCHRDSENLPPDHSLAPYRIYNIGNNSHIKLLDFIKILEKSIGKEAKKNFMAMQDGDVVSTYADIDDLVNDFGYTPNTDLKKGIEVFISWYKKFYNV